MYQSKTGSALKTLVSVTIVNSVTRNIATFCSDSPEEVEQFIRTAMGEEGEEVAGQVIQSDDVNSNGTIRAGYNLTGDGKHAITLVNIFSEEDTKGVQDARAEAQAQRERIRELLSNPNSPEAELSEFVSQLAEAQGITNELIAE